MLVLVCLAQTVRQGNVESREPRAQVVVLVSLVSLVVTASLVLLANTPRTERMARMVWRAREVHLARKESRVMLAMK